ANKMMASICAVAPPSEPAAQLALLDAIAEAAVCARKVLDAGSFMSPLFSSWNGTASDWDLIGAQVNWTIGAWTGIREGKFPAWCVDPRRISVDRIAAARQLRAVQGDREAWNSALRDWSSRLQIDDSPVLPFAGQPFANLKTRWNLQAGRIDELHALVAYNQ